MREKTGRIVRAAIHPGIGIARVGNSRDGYFIGPEVPFPRHAAPGFYKDRAGALKRQAARFHVYGFDKNGAVVRELDATNARITWTVHLANKKAAWYNFERALDIPEAVPCTRRNAAFVGAKRQDLVIDPGPRSIVGRPSRKAARFDTGRFLGTRVYLGELRTDAQGRLLVLGGRGISDTAFPHNTPYTFGNNDGWHDDTSDGPVTADVEVGGRQIPVDPAWVVIAPPNYAPDIVSVQTMYDVLCDAYQGYWLAPVTRPSFTRHIYPLLCQFSDTQWVNLGFHLQFGYGAPNDFLRNDYVEKLATITRDATGVTDIYKDLRLQVLHLFRDPAAAVPDPTKWPQMYGDAAGLDTSPRAYLTLTATQYGFLEQWAAGQFVDDWQGERPMLRSLDEVPVADRPATLDRAALWFCLGGPFHPGCEMTWPMRNVTMYYAPFRIRPRAPNQPEPDYGPVLTPAVATGEAGPLCANGPGDITRWMAVPWQSDSACCRSGYNAQYDPYLPTFWPARVPNHVLSENDYRILMNRRLPTAQRQHAFDHRSAWLRWFGSTHHMDQMIAGFGRLGIVERRDGPGDAGFPPEVYVESQVGFGHEPHFQHNLANPSVDKLARPRSRRDPA